MGHADVPHCLTPDEMRGRYFGGSMPMIPTSMYCPPLVCLYLAHRTRLAFITQIIEDPQPDGVAHRPQHQRHRGQGVHGDQGRVI
ncbi:MAG TPA: hypothetical protein VGM51_05390 [Armatimonadota bacterium]|jgi:hypothetical protein